MNELPGHFRTRKTLRKGARLGGLSELPPLLLHTLDAPHLACAHVAGETELVATDNHLRGAVKLLCWASLSFQFEFGSAAQFRIPLSARRHFEMQATTNLFDSTTWRPFDVPGNRPSCSSTNSEMAAED